MLITRPLTILLYIVVVAVGHIASDRTSELKRPSVRRLEQPPVCSQQVAREQDYGVRRVKGARARGRC